MLGEIALEGQDSDLQVVVWRDDSFGLTYPTRLALSNSLAQPPWAGYLAVWLAAARNMWATSRAGSPSK